MTKTLIQVDKITQQFNVGDEQITPLKDVSFSILENSFNIVYGASGSGKSTLLNVLTGLQPPTKCRVLFDGKDIYSMKPDSVANFRANKIGFVYQTNYWVKSLNVLDNVAMSLFFMGYSRRQSYKTAMQALQLVKMDGYAKKNPVLLSGGEQQRVAMARALATSPMFVIADEPTGSLDSANGEMIMNLLRSCQKDLNRTVILVTHNMEYLPLADKLLHIEDGRLQEMRQDSIEGTMRTLMNDMQGRIQKLSQEKKRAVSKK